MNDDKSSRERFASCLKLVGGVAVKVALFKFGVWLWDKFNPFQ